jgi:hypothetical protein
MKIDNPMIAVTAKNVRKSDIWLRIPFGGTDLIMVPVTRNLRQSSRGTPPQKFRPVRGDAHHLEREDYAPASLRAEEGFPWCRR